MADFDLSSNFIASLDKPSSLLPIAKYRQELLYAIEKYPVTVIIGQTGSGKTTQLPQFLEQAGWCKDAKVIAVTQVGTLTPTFFAWLKAYLTLHTASKSGRDVCSGPSGRGDAVQRR